MTNIRSKLTLLLLSATTVLSVAQEPVKKTIIFNTTSRVIRGPYAGSEQVQAGEAQREITPQEFDAIDAIHRSGGFAVDDPAGIRAATFEESDERKGFRASVLDRIGRVPNLANRAIAYQAATAVFLALENRDKEGAKAIVDTMTTFAPAVRDRLKSLIDAALP